MSSDAPKPSSQIETKPPVKIEIERGWRFRFALGQKMPDDPKSIWGAIIWAMQTVASALGIKVELKGRDRISIDHSQSNDPEHIEAKRVVNEAVRREIEAVLDRPADATPAQRADTAKREPKSVDERTRLLLEIQRELEELKKDGYDVNLRPSDDIEDINDTNDI